MLDADQERLEAEAEIVRALRDEHAAAYTLLQAMGLLTVEHLRLGVEPYEPDVYYRSVQNGPPGGSPLGGRPHPRAVGAQLR